MSAGRALIAAGCFHCRTSVPKLLLGAGPRPSTPLRTRVLASLHPVLNQASRGFSSAPDPVESPDKSELRQDDNRAASESQDGDDLSTEMSPASTPWYLQVEPPRHATAAEPLPLPELPRDPPRIMEPLLKYASEEMGLDDLALLDLRELNPPPALGPNLFMLFGTARSERHLNVSAGRLVRWLRAKHHIYANADGLLGPNERKTKLRRIAKRAKLLGTMGTDDADDGISTGWICVNLGTINRDNRESTIVGEDGRLSGFGVSQLGSTIVVQVMTESRRAELNLETLWQKILDRQLKKASMVDQDSEDSVEPAISSKSQSPYGSRLTRSLGLSQSR